MIASTVEGNIDCGGRFIGCYGNAPLKQKHSVTIFREPVARLRSSFMVKEFPGGNEQEKVNFYYYYYQYLLSYFFYFFFYFSLFFFFSLII